MLWNFPRAVRNTPCGTGAAPCADTLFEGSVLMTTAKVQSTHQERMAYVYVRQSTPLQVIEHRESTERQYHLRERAIELGWPASRVDVIDEDQGRSGSTATHRSGFQRL